MKKFVLLLILAVPLLTFAQTKIKETQVPKSVLIALDKKYDSYKVKTWYRSPVNTLPSSYMTVRTAVPISPTTVIGNTAASPPVRKTAPPR